MQKAVYIIIIVLTNVVGNPIKAEKQNITKDTILQYFLLNEKLLQFEQAQKKENAINIDFATRDSVKIFSQIKQKLIQLGYSMYDYQLINSVTQFRNEILEFQHDYGLVEDGIIGKNFKSEINIPISERIIKIKKNMERAAQMPPMHTNQVMVNIPAFEMNVYDHDTLIMKSEIIVGKRKTKTACITGEFKYIVFNPYWNIPTSILKKEIIPEILKNADYLENNDMEWVGDRLRQRPGSKNALGRVKFIFPNPYNMYLHDTPNKYLFQKSKRMFSHGCIRIAKPVEFASYLLGKESSSWSNETIMDAMNSPGERTIKLHGKVNIMVYYMTVYVGENGRLQFRNDIYGLD